MGFNSAFKGLNKQIAVELFRSAGMRSFVSGWVVPGVLKKTWCLCLEVASSIRNIKNVEENVVM